MTNYNKTELETKRGFETSILVVDDAEINFKLICAILRNSNFNIVWAKDGYEALQNIASGQHFDLVFMDYQMPGMNGIETARQMKLINNDLSFIMQTASVYGEDMTQINAAFEDVLMKPYRPGVLLNKVQKHLQLHPMLVS